MSQSDQSATATHGLRHAGGSSSQWVLDFLPLLRLLHKAALISLLLLFVTWKHGKPYLRIEYQYRGSRDNIISADYWAPYGKLHVHGHCPLVIWVKEPLCAAAHPATLP